MMVAHPERWVQQDLWNALAKVGVKDKDGTDWSAFTSDELAVCCQACKKWRCGTPSDPKVGAVFCAQISDAPESPFWCTFCKRMLDRGAAQHTFISRACMQWRSQAMTWFVLSISD